LYRLDGKSTRRVHHDLTLTADPGDDGGTVFVIVAAAGFALFAATARRRPNAFFPPCLAWPFCPAVW
jgi:MYXO-CTERM domain-containing protein